jgi:hypothetical protein
VPDTSQISSRIYIHIIPSTDEDDDMETFSLVEDVRQDFLDEISQLETFTVVVAGAQTRDAGLIVLIPEIVNGIIAQKDLIVLFFQTSKLAIDALSKRGHVKTIEMAIDGDSIRIEDASYAQADRLISIFEAQHPGKVQQITPSSTIEVIGTISKTEQPAIAERTVTEKRNS